MIGLLFIFVLVVWAIIALALGNKIPKWLGIARHQKIWGLMLALLVFVAPIADEIIAYPQLRALCTQVNGLTLAAGMTAKKAYGKTVYSIESATTESLWPSSVKVSRVNYAYIDATTKEPILQGIWFEPLRGMLGVPNGSSGGRMTVFLNKCESRVEVYDTQGVPTRFSHLKLTKIPTP